MAVITYFSTWNYTAAATIRYLSGVTYGVLSAPLDGSGRAAPTSVIFDPFGVSGLYRVKFFSPKFCNGYAQNRPGSCVGQKFGYDYIDVVDPTETFTLYRPYGGKPREVVNGKFERSFSRTLTFIGHAANGRVELFFSPVFEGSAQPTDDDFPDAMKFGYAVYLDGDPRGRQGTSSSNFADALPVGFVGTQGPYTPIPGRPRIGSIVHAVPVPASFALLLTAAVAVAAHGLARRGREDFSR